jgi:hypothetical protein
MNASAELVFQADESSRPVHCLDTFNWTRFAQPCADVDAQCALLDEFCSPDGSQERRPDPSSLRVSYIFNDNQHRLWKRVIADRLLHSLPRGKTMYFPLPDEVRTA